jgi:hypothetical protein
LFGEVGLAGNEGGDGSVLRREYGLERRERADSYECEPGNNMSRRDSEILDPEEESGCFGRAAGARPTHRKKGDAAAACRGGVSGDIAGGEGDVGEVEGCKAASVGSRRIFAKGRAVYDEATGRDTAANMDI